MNEITRIHLAKVPYEIEIAAKKQLESYLRALEDFTDDSDWLQDIEIRITEILDEHNVKRNDLITSDEIKAIRAQLGEPEDFYGEGDIAVGAPTHTPEVASRRLYRDPSTAMLGGVLSGLGHYVKINPIWLRLIFIILLFVSFGTVSIIYVILWILLPPANSVATQLELSGEPVTLASLKAQRQKAGRSGEISRAADITRKVLLYGTGTFATIMAAVVLVAVIWVAAGFIYGSALFGVTADSMALSGFNFWAAYGLGVISGLLLSTFFSLIAIMCFKRSFPKSIRIALVTVVVAGIVSFGSAVGFAAYEGFQRTAEIEASRTTKTVQLPANFSTATGVSIGTTARDEGVMDDAVEFTNVQYVVSTRAPRYEITRTSQTAKINPVITMDENGVINVSLKNAQKDKLGFGYRQYPSLKIYGPALSKITVLSGNVEYQSAQPQEELAIDAKRGGLSITGAYKTVVANVDSADLRIADASIENLNLTLTSGQVAAGVVRTLTVTQPDVCPAQSSHASSQSSLTVQAVSSGKINYNGTERDAVSFKQVCGEVVVGDREVDEDIYL